jgi:hypothetical protein
MKNLSKTDLIGLAKQIAFYIGLIALLSLLTYWWIEFIKIVQS